MMQIKCFGIAKEIVTADIAELDLCESTVSQVRLSLEKKYPSFSKINGYMVAVNQEYASDDQLVTDKDEIAIIPPVSGG